MLISYAFLYYLDIGAVIYFPLRLLISLMAAKIMKIFIPVILFYGNKNVCVGFVSWFLYALLLLKLFLV